MSNCERFGFMKKYLSLLVIFVAIFLTACQNKPSTSINSDTNNSDISMSSETESIKNTENSISDVNLTDRSYDDLSEKEKRQLKYFNDGYTFFYRGNGTWYLYKYGELFKTFDGNTKFPEADNYLYDTTDTYIVINNALYFTLTSSGLNESDQVDVFKFDFSTNEVTKYIDRTSFKEYSIGRIQMLKHNDKLVFLCPATSWYNIIEVDTKNISPKLEYKQKSETIEKYEDTSYSYYYNKYIPIDSDNYKIINYDNTKGYICKNLSLVDYSVKDETSYEYDSANGDIIGCFYQEQGPISYSYEVVDEETNQLTGEKERKNKILSWTPNDNSKIRGEHFPQFATNKEIAKQSVLSEDWLIFFAYSYYTNGNDSNSISPFIYYFNDNKLCTMGLYTSFDLWNAYDDVKPTKLDSFINNVYKLEKPIY